MADVRIHLPSSLRAYWTGPAEAPVTAATLAEALAELGRRWPGLADRILDDRGRVRPHVGLFVNALPVMHREPRDVALADGDVVRVLPAVSGGN
jgi:molybdopterin synthase sulfur carrier subunit